VVLFLVRRRRAVLKRVAVAALVVCCVLFGFVQGENENEETA
jgi:hypothetical protein